MRRALSLLIALAVCAMPMARPCGHRLARPSISNTSTQRVVGATLFVSPAGETLLVDAGNAASATERSRVLKLAGVKQIDHFWLTHYHGDHYGA